MDTENQPDNVSQAFASAAEKFRNKTAIIYLGTCFSYGDILEFTENFAASLRKQGVAEGEKVILYIPNSVHWVIAWLGIQRAGAV
ncbi:MAG TPA: AMP-binding protein, partial [Deltaproteobacteria bacterium]|nr:AMP-binding protein [Deltaproteobacteria bacterium]